MKKITPLKSLALLITLFCAVTFGFGQEIASFSSVQNSGCSGVVYNDINMTASGICRGPGIVETTSGSPINYNSRDWTTASTLDTNDYLEWTLTPNSGYKVDLSTMNITYDRSPNGPSMVDIQVDTGSGFTSIFTDTSVSDSTEDNNGIDLSSYTGIIGTITFRLYAFSAIDSGGTFDIDENTATNKGVLINGTVSDVSCTGLTTTWDGISWTPSVPDNTTPAIINGTYTTNPTDGSFTACSLTVNGTLTIDDGYFVEVINVVIVNGGSIDIQSSGALVQRGLGASAGTFSIINGGDATLTKFTKDFNNDGDFHYTYWSSPVDAADIVTIYPDPAGNRRYYFEASAFLDEHTVGTTNGVPDDIDDNNNDWRTATGNMQIGTGYAVTATDGPPFPGGTYSDIATFSGIYNTGDYDVTIYRNDTSTGDNNWNLIGNPYPSAIDAEEFLLQNYYDVSNPTGTLEGVIYLWSHNTAASSANPGNQAYNYSQDDYATMNLVGGVLGGSPSPSGSPTPNGYIPSGQGFFVTFADAAPTTGGAFPDYTNTVNFNNDMRMADGTSNSQFFKNSNSKKKSTNNSNKLWINLTSDNGVFNQILIGYVNGASNNYDGSSLDSKRRLTSGFPATLYSTIENLDKKFAIQGKDINSINEDEIINLGFSTTIDVATIYTLSIAQIEGDFLSNNPIYLKDNLLNQLHDLSASDYTFTSEVGEFNERFEIVFSSTALSTDEVTLNSKSLRIIELEDDRVQFTASDNLRIKSVNIFDLLGRQLYSFKGDNASETYRLYNLHSSIYIAKVALSNGVVVTKKAIKK